MGHLDQDMASWNSDSKVEYYYLVFSCLVVSLYCLVNICCKLVCGGLKKQRDVSQVAREKKTRG
jgi:hypothetical protein